MKSGACKGCTMRTVGCHGKNPDGSWKCRTWETPSEPSKTGPTGKGRATERMRNRRRRFRMVRSLRGRSRKPRRRSGRRPRTPEWRPASGASTSRRASTDSRASERTVTWTERDEFVAEKRKRDILWEVGCEGHTDAWVIAENWELATVEAARFWGVPWGKVAASCEQKQRIVGAPRNIC